MALSSIRFGIIGFGNMGKGHAAYLAAGEVPGASLAAVADVIPASLQAARTQYGERLKYYETPEALLASGEIDAVLVATPHYDHVPLTKAALARGIHALVEKPAGVYTKEVRELNATAAAAKATYGIMFNQRARGAHQKVRELVASGELGEIRRTEYVITNWLRSQAYYNSGGWRGTWAGEGGGVLMNQCPHNLDLFQWFCGMPSRVRAFCKFGHLHNIEVEDSVTAYLEYPNGATGVFITTTGEAPGVNRLEIAGDRGRLVLENDAITFYRTRQSVSELIKTTPSSFPNLESWTISIPTGPAGEEHKGITKNFVSAILHGTPLLAKGEEGIHGLELANAMLLSTWIDHWVNLPLDDDRYHAELQKRIATSSYKKPAV
jgi:predicted dehydrogenase